jgi:hypothetical protein
MPLPPLPEAVSAASGAQRLAVIRLLLARERDPVVEVRIGSALAQLERWQGQRWQGQGWQGQVKKEEKRGLTGWEQWQN